MVTARTRDGLALALVLTLLPAACERAGDGPPPPAARRGGGADLAAARERLDATVWAPEVLAQRYGETLVRFWDRLRGARDGLAVLAEFPFERLRVGAPLAPESLGGGLRLTRFAPPEEELSRAVWTSLVGRFRETGFAVRSSEWRHVAFTPAAEGAPSSDVEMTLNLAHAGGGRALSARARLTIAWATREDPSAELFLPREVAVSSLETLQRDGPAHFAERFEVEGEPGPSNEGSLQPLIVYDFDFDGLPEIVLGGLNRIYRNRGHGRFEGEALCAYPVRMYKPGVVADFTGDGLADFACVSRDGRPRLYVAQGPGIFSQPTRTILETALAFPSVLTAGDVDGDGDLDLFIAQYKPPYAGGQMPTPYYDANDGHPAFLLTNRGDGTFVDRTLESGLGAKRFRRTYSASFVALDDDDHLDLLVVSDFSGVDLYRNIGDGTFADDTAARLAEPHTFGMAHAFGDFDRDGRTDFYVTGMSSAAAARLDHLDLGRAEFPEHNRMRPVLAFGNRMYLARGERFEEPGFREQIARTGWSWGTAALDVENDGDLDLYVANGHRSGASARDYCPRFWTHDVYTGMSRPDADLAELFTHEFEPLLRNELSWDGHQLNVLYLDAGDGRWIDIAPLAGVAFPFDSRGVVADDLDGDGFADLLVVEQRWDPVAQVLHVLANRAPRGANWIGVRLREVAGAASPVGARIRVRTAAGEREATIVTGDSFYAQHSTSKVFGLGATDRVEWIRVRWADGSQAERVDPALNQYHEFLP